MIRSTSRAEPGFDEMARNGALGGDEELESRVVCEDDVGLRPVHRDRGGGGLCDGLLGEPFAVEEFRGVDLQGPGHVSGGGEADHRRLREWPCLARDVVHVGDYGAGLLHDYPAYRVLVGLADLHETGECRVQPGRVPIRSAGFY
jgi:hypothetical protein